MHADLDAYIWDESIRVKDDIVVFAAREDFDGQGLIEVFGRKTEGYPHHQALLAVGMLVEARFPQYAMVSGKIDRAQASSPGTCPDRRLAWKWWRERPNCLRLHLQNHSHFFYCQY